MGNFKYWGIEYFKTQDVDCSYFPTIVSCHINFGAEAGINNHNYLCILPTNTLNAFFLMLLWFHLVFMVPVALLALFYRIAYALCPKLAR